MFSPRTCLTARQASPAQLVVITLIESLVFQLNRKLLAEGKFHFTDTGGTIIIHMFGAYYGLMCAWILGKPPDDERSKDNEATSFTSDLFSLLGTVFLWIYWPSFNGGLDFGCVPHPTPKGPLNGMRANQPHFSSSTARRSTATWQSPTP